MDACFAGDMDGLMRLLAEDVTVWSDGGGKVTGAARQPIQGREHVTRAFIKQLSRAPEGTTVEVSEVNGFPAVLIRVSGEVMGVLTIEVADGLIRAIRSVANPDKLAHLKLPPKPGQGRRLSDSPFISND